MNLTYEIDGIKITVCKTLAEAQSIRRTNPNAPEEAFLFPVTIPVDETQTARGFKVRESKTITGTAMLGYDTSTPDGQFLMLSGGYRPPFVSIIYNWTPPETAEDFGYMLDDFTAWADCTGNERDAEGTLLKNLL